ncbi:MAG TPA: DUF512 domain-containing protein [Dehalococcoidia bacterium]
MSLVRNPHNTPLQGGVVDWVEPGSLAEEAGLQPGDRIVAVDGHPLRDVVDFQFLAAEEVIQLSVIGRDGRVRTVAIEKHPDEDVGLAFRDATFDGIITCNNNCPFCFLKGLPKGLRRTIYVKDDDYRLSFLHGNFVTLTNLTEEDWERLDEQRLSPLNVSVHATDLALRRYLLGNPNAPDILAQLRRLGRLHIRVHTQVVLWPGVNDGAHLDRTIGDLGALYPTVQTISVVPVGATEEYERRSELGRLARLERCEPAYARRLVRQVRRWQRRFRREHGATIVFPSDEYYLAAGARVPAAHHYEGYPQYENGVGMVRRFLEDWQRTRRRIRRGGLPAVRRRVTLAASTLGTPVLARVCAELQALTGIQVQVVPVANRFFGERINVAGLLVARDFIQALRGRDLGDLLILPRHALDYFGRHFLDDGTPADVQSAVGVPVAFATTMSEVLDLALDPPEEIEVPAAASTAGRSWAQ